MFNIRSFMANKRFSKLKLDNVVYNDQPSAVNAHKYIINK